MKVPIGELADRYTILLLKKERTDLDVDEELNLYKDELNGYWICEDITLYAGIRALLTINGKIWDLESDIRKGKEGELGLKEVGKRALQIRDFNKDRVSFKNALNKHFNEGFQETKKEHASEK